MCRDSRLDATNFHPPLLEDMRSLPDSQYPTTRGTEAQRPSCYPHPPGSTQRPTRRAPPADHRREALDLNKHGQKQATVEMVGAVRQMEEEEEDEDEEIDVEHVEEDDSMEYGDEAEVQEHVHVKTKSETAGTPQPTPLTRQTT
ncbi:hypothetical protein E2C01_053821 [Portunus trituberculatus]|uniref:Uncharacterized protein n=1 Tax=Portunus trituberculatus TaxID=210409 RepID=A0A5B7GQC2_PORTR|nr:hypothetical protein [Portunus trituberculatus]